MKKVLIVDDDKTFLLSLRDLLTDSSGDYSVLTASNGKAAVEILNKDSVDLVVTDLKMPEMDGFDLLAHLSTATPDTPVIAMTAFGTPDMENRLMDMGAFQYIEKPIDFKTLQQKISDGLSSSSGGHVAGISIASFMQLLELDKKTCTLNVKSQGKTGVLYLSQGELLDAETGDMKGQAAAIEIASWEHAEIDITNTCSKRENTVNTPMGFILLESVRLRDERKMGKAPSSGTAEEAPQQAVEKPAAAPPVVEEPKQAAPAEEPKAVEADDPISELVNSVSTIQGVSKMIIISRDGTILSQKNTDNKQFGTFIAYTAMAAEQFKKVLGFNGPQHIDMSQTNGAKILILPGPDVIIGLEIDAEASVAAVADSLRPVIRRTKIN